MSQNRRKRILYIIGTPNQTTQMHQIAELLPECDHYFSQFYADSNIIRTYESLGFLDNTIMGVKGKFKKQSDDYLLANGLNNDYRGGIFNHDYDLAIVCTDMILPKKVTDTKKIVWVQEGMIDPMTTLSKVVKALGLPAWLAGDTSLNGSGNKCDIFCVASEGYSSYIAENGTEKSKTIVTGIPNFDNLATHLKNNFPHKGYVMVATTDFRETMRSEDRVGFIKHCVKIANGRKMLFKLHPNEQWDRAKAEIEAHAPEGSMVFQQGSTNDMIANCVELITQYSTVVYVGIALNKKVHSFLPLDELYRNAPIQNGGQSAQNIADICRAFLAYNGPRKDFLNEYKRSLQGKTSQVLEESYAG